MDCGSDNVFVPITFPDFDKCGYVSRSLRKYPVFTNKEGINSSEKICTCVQIDQIEKDIDKMMNTWGKILAIRESG